MLQLIAVHPDGKQTVINNTQDINYLDKIVEDRDGTMWIGSDMCDLRVQIVKVAYHLCGKVGEENVHL